MASDNTFKELACGATLQSGKYTIERVIGAGGFGITYYARHNGLGHYFAIKEFFISAYCMRNSVQKTVMLQGIDPAVYDKYRQKFIEEAQILARLDHQNIVKVTDIFQENNTAYIVMPFIEGQTLQQLVTQKGRLDYDTAVNYIAQLSEAVDYIHQRDILHRDIKPDNIIITPADKAILIDFGSAREFIHDKTQQHTSIFTQGYAPLEQYSTSSKKGSYSDIYSLGATFYFALTGQKPMDAATRTMESMPEPKAFVPSIPYEANRTILKAMSLKTENRQQRIGEFMDDLLNTEKNPTRSTEQIRDKHQKKSSNTFSKFIPIIVITLICIVIGTLWFDSYTKKQEQLAQGERERQEQLERIRQLEETLRQEQIACEEKLRQEQIACEEKLRQEQLATKKINYLIYTNYYYNYSIKYPSFLIPQGESQNGDGQSFEYQNARLSVYKNFKIDDKLTINQLYNKDVNSFINDNAKIEYKLMKTNFFVISGFQNNNIFYQRTIIDKKSRRYLTGILTFDRSQKDFFDDIVTDIFNSMKFN